MSVCPDEEKRENSLNHCHVMASSEKPDITLVTGNAGKLREITTCLAGHATVRSVHLDIPELQSDSIHEISKEKARWAYNHVKRPVLVEDTGLGFEALNGLPGAYCKWFLKSIGPDGLIKMLSGFENKKAHAMCVFTYFDGSENVRQFEGRCDGKIVDVARGTSGFGWDSIFEPDKGQGMTFAEMPEEIKNAISHRAVALSALRAQFL